MMTASERGGIDCVTDVLETQKERSVKNMVRHQKIGGSLVLIFFFLAALLADLCFPISVLLLIGAAFAAVYGQCDHKRTSIEEIEHDYSA